MNTVRDHMGRLQIIQMDGPTGGHPLDPAELSELGLTGPPIQVMEMVPVDPPSVTPTDTKLFDDLVARLGPDAIQKLLDQYRRTAVSRAG